LFAILIVLFVPAGAARASLALSSRLGLVGTAFMVAMRQDFGDDHKHWKLPEYADELAWSSCSVCETAQITGLRGMLTVVSDSMP
jgi:hypothetical protein